MFFCLVHRSALITDLFCETLSNDPILQELLSFSLRGRKVDGVLCTRAHEPHDPHDNVGG